MNMREWVEIPGNRDRFRDWSTDSTTQEILSCWHDQFAPTPIDTGAEKTEVALYLHGQNVMSSQIVHTLRTLDDPLPEAGSIEATYGMKEVLKAQGYTDIDAQRMASDYMVEQKALEGS